MDYGIRLTVWGKRACFTRPEFGTERVSYDVITPSAARGIIEAIYWKPAIRWIVDRIQVNNEVKHRNIVTNEVKSKYPKFSVQKVLSEGTPLYLDTSKERTQRSSVILADVSYTIEAHFELVGDYPPDVREGLEAKHISYARRRIKGGKCRRQPYLGISEYVAHFEWAEEFPESFYKDVAEKDLSWMLYDIDYNNNMTPIFYRPVMKCGVIEVGDCHASN